jgi:3-hydroxyisobutyryl-CoA hydrolase
MIDSLIEDHYYEPMPDEKPNHITNGIRVAVDAAFGHDSVDAIFAALKNMVESEADAVKDWAKITLAALEFRSPTSLKVVLNIPRISLTVHHACVRINA